DLGNIETAQAETASQGNRQAKYLPEIAASCRRLAAAVGQCLSKGALPLALGGDHSIAVGTASGVSQYCRESGQNTGILWLDAHADMNTPESSPSGNVHGMPLACILGLGPPELTHLFDYAPKVRPRNAVIVGLRDVNQMEKPHVRQSGIRAFTM